MDQIEEVLTKTDIVPLINERVSLRKAGRNFKALCPFHSEKTPSFVVSPELQIYKCFGCGEGGNAIKFLTDYEKMSFSEALRYLADRAGVKLTTYQLTEEQQEKDRLLAINHLASEYFHYLLTKHKVGEASRRYLGIRGINPGSIKLFKLGYAPSGWNSLYDFIVGKKHYNPRDVLKTGLIIQSRNFYDRFRSRIIFPLHNHRGEVVGFSGRVLTPDLKNAKYINTPETTVYHKGSLLYGLEITQKEIKKKNKAIIVEGELDVISSYQVGVRHVVAVKGSALTENQINLIKRFCDTIVLCMDADTAGDAAMRRGIELADKADLNVRVIEIAGSKDVDELVRKSAQAWKEKADKTIPVFDFFINSALRRFNHKSAEGKKRISNELMPILTKINNEVIKAHYIKKLAGVLAVQEEAVIKELTRVTKKEQIGSKAAFYSTPAKTVTKTRREMLEETLLSLLLQKGAEDKQLLASIDENKIQTFIITKTIKKLKSFIEKNKFNIRYFVDSVPTEFRTVLDQLYLYEWKGLLEDERKFIRQFNLVKNEITKLYLKDRIKELKELVSVTEERNKRQDLREKISLLAKEFKDL